tara:strand:- start:515 stop:790 length:276 start_codon:yes stop_codon:yes gene_type:complete
MAKKTKSFDLRKFILQEAAKLSGKLVPTSKVKAKEYKAGQEASQLEKNVNHAKHLKLKEAKIKAAHKRLVLEMRKLQKRKVALKKRIIKDI